MRTSRRSLPFVKKANSHRSRKAVTGARRASRRAILASSILSLLGISLGTTHADSYLWNPGGANGGSGLWDLTSQNWFDVTAGGPSLWTNGAGASADTAVFGGTTPGTYTVELDAPIVANGLTFDINGYTIANDAGAFQKLTLDAGAGPAFLAVTNASDTATISASLDGAGFAKRGAGTLVLSGANTLSGPVTIEGGRLRLASAGALNAAAPTAVSFAGASNGVLQLNGFSTTVSGLNGDATAVVENGALTAATLTVRQAGLLVPVQSASTFHGLLRDGTGGGALNLTKTGAGSLRLTNSGNTFSGEVVVNNGSLIISDPAQLGTGTTAISVNGFGNTGNPGFGGGQLILEGATTGAGMTIQREITVTGSGPGASNRNAGLVSIGNNTLAGDLVFASTGSEGRIAATHGVTTVTGGVMLGTAANAIVYGNGNFIFSGVVTGIDPAVQDRFIKTGNVVATTLWLQNSANNFAQPLRIDSGTVRVQSSGALGLSTSTLGVDLNGALLEVRTDNGDFSAHNVNIRGNSNSFMVDHDLGSSLLNQTVTFGALANSASNATISMNGRNGYNLSLGNGGTTNWPTGNPLSLSNTGSSGTLIINGSINHLSETTVRNLTVTSSGEVVIKGDLLQVAGGAAVSLVKNNTGMLTLEGTGTSTFTGTTTINAGTLTIGSFNQLPTGALLIGNATTTSGALNYVGAGETSSKAITFNTTTANEYINANGTGALILDGAITAVAGNKTIVLGGASTAENEIQSSIPNSTNLSLQKIGSGTWVLSGANAFTGGSGVTVSGGTLKVKDTFAGGSRDVIANANALVFNTDLFSQAAGGSFQYVGAAGADSTETLGALTATAGHGTIAALPGTGGTAVLTFGALGTRSVGSTVNVLGTGAVNVTGTAGFLNAGIYFNGVDYAFSGDGTTLRAPNYALDAGFAEAGGALVAASHNMVTSGTDSGALTIRSLKISGSSTVMQTGLLTIQTAANSPGGIIQTGGAGVISGTGVTTGGTGDLVIRVSGSGDTLSMSAPITSTTTGGLTKSGEGLLILSGAQAYSGATTINEGTIKLDTGSRLGGGAASNNNNLAVRQAGALDINGNSIGVGNFSGAGSVTNSSASFATLTIGNNNQAGYFTGLISGNLGLTKTGSSTAMSITGLNTFTGPVTLSGGTLIVNNIANIGAPSALGAGDATDAASNAASLVFNGGALLYQGANGVIYQNTQTPSVTTNRLFTLAGNGTIDSTGTFGAPTLTAVGNNASLVFGNTGAVAFSGAGARTLTIQGSSTGDNRINLQLVNNPNADETLSVTKSGSGLWILGNAANSYTGTTTISGGALQAQDGASLPTASNLFLNGGVLQSSGTLSRTLGTDGGQLRFVANGNGGFSAGLAPFKVDLSGQGTPVWGSTANFLGAGSLILNSGTSLADVEIAGNFDLAPGAAATPTLTTTSGSTTVTLTAGTTTGLTVGQAITGTNIPAGSYINSINSTTSISISQAASASGTGIAGTIAEGGFRQIQVDDNGTTNLDFATVSGVIGGTGGLSKIGSAPLILGNANTYSGNSIIRQEAVFASSIGAAGATSSSFGTNVGGGVLELGNPGTTTTVNLMYVGPGETTTRPVYLTGTTGTRRIDASGSGPLILTNLQNSTATSVNTTGGAKTLELRGNNVDLNMITSVLADNSGALTVNKFDGGVWVLNPAAANTFTGILTVGGGSLGLTANGIGATPQINTSNAAIFAYGGALETSTPVQLNNNTTVVFAGSNNITLNGNVTKQAGANDQTFSNNLENGAVLTINGNFVNAQTTAGTRSIFIRGDGSTVWNGVIQDNSATSLTRFDIRLADTASFTLGGENTLTGGILHGQGTLIVGHAKGLGPAANNVILDGGVFTSTLDLTGANKILNRIQLQGDQVTINGNQNIEFGGAIAMDQNGSRFILNNLDPGKMLTISGQVNLTVDSNVRTLTVRGTGDTLISGVVANGGTGASGLAFSGRGTLEFTGANTATGALTVNRNTITISGASGSWNSGSVLLNPTGTLLLNNLTGDNASGRLNNTGAITGNGGTLEIIGSPTGTNEVAGPLTLNNVQTFIKMTDNTGGVGTNTLSFASVATPNTGSSLNLAGVPNLGTVNLVKFGGTIPANALINGVMPRTFIAGGDFAAYDATNGVVAFTGYNPTSATDINLAAPTDTVAVNTGMTTASLTAHKTINALKIDGSGLSVGGAGQTLTLSAAALLNTGGNNSLDTTLVNFGGNTGFIQVDPGTTLTVNSALIGTGGLAFARAGTVVLNTPSFVTSTTNVLRGTVKLNAGVNTLFPNQLLNINDGATLDLNGNAQYTAQLSDPGTLPGSGGVITSTSGTGTYVTNMAATTAVQTQITGPVNFARLNGNTLTMGSPQTYTGSTTMHGGTLALQDDATILNTSKIDLNAATLLLNNNGSLQTGLYDRIGDNIPITLRDGTIQFAGKVSDASRETFGPLISAQGANSVVVTTGGTGTAGAFASADVTFANLTRGAGTTMNFAGSSAQGGIGNFPRILITAAPETYLGGALGAWAIANSTDYAGYNSTNGVGTIGNGGYTGYDGTFGSGKITNVGTISSVPQTTTLTGNTTAAMLKLSGTFENNIAFSAPGDVLNLELGGILRANNTFSTTFGSPTARGVVTAGGTETTGTRELIIFGNTGGNPTFGGGTTPVTSTTLIMSSTQGLQPGMTITGANLPADTKIVSVDSLNQVTISRASTNTTALTSQTYTAGSFVNGTTSTGSAVVTTNSTTGVTPGMTITGTNVPVGTYVVSVDSPTQLTLSQNTTGNSTTGAFTIGVGNIIVNSVIADNGLGNSVKLIKSGGGVLNLSANNTYTGGTVVDQGTVNLIGQGVVIPAGGLLLGGANMTMNTNAGQIDPSNSVLLRRSSVLTLTGNNTLDSINFDNNGGTGTPTVTIGAGNTLSLSNSTPVSVITNNALTVPTISAGTLALGAGAKTFDVGAIQIDGVTYTNIHSSLNITSVITGDGPINKTGGGLLQLSGQNTFNGLNVLDGGIVLSASSTSTIPATLVSGPLGAGSVSMAAGTSLLVDNNSRIVANAISFAGNPFFNNTGTGVPTLTLNGALDFATLQTTGLVVNIGTPFLNVALAGPIANIGAVTSIGGATGPNTITKSALGNITSLNLTGIGATVPINIGGLNNLSTISLFHDGDGTGSTETINVGALTFPGLPNLTIGRAGTGPYFAQALNKTIALASISSIAGGLTLTVNNGYGLLIGDEVALNDGVTFTVTNASGSNVVQGLTLDGVISGATTGFTKAGSGTLVLANPGNTFGGAGAVIDITGGYLSVSEDAALGNLANSVRLSANSTVQGFRATGTFGTSRTITLNAANTSIEVSNGNTLTLNSAFGLGAVANGLTKNDRGTLVLAADNPTWNGVMTINQGVVRITDAGALGTATGNTVINTLIGQLQVSGGITVAEPIGIAGAQNQTFSGIDSTGALRSVSGNNTWSGAISLNTASNTDNQMRAATITVDAGSTLNLTGGLTATMATSGTGRNMWFALGGEGTGNITAPISHTGGSANNFLQLAKIGGGTWNLQVANGFTGHQLYVNGGTFSLNGNGSLGVPGAGGATASNTVFITRNGTLALDNTGTNVNNRLGGSRNLDLRGGNLTILGNADANTTETITGGMVFNFGKATITLDADPARQLSFTTGPVTRTQGGTALFRGDNLGSAAGNGVATVQATGAGYVTTGQTGAAGSVNKGIIPWALVDTSATGSGTSFATVDTATSILRPLAAGEINSGSLVANGNIFLSGATPTVATNTTINSLTLGSTGGVVIEPLATLILDSGGILATAGNAGIHGGLLSTTSNREVIVHALGDLEISSSIVRLSGGLTKSGAGTLTLSSPNNYYTGATYLAEGTLKLAGGNNTIYYNSSFVLQGGTLDLNGTNQHLNNVQSQTATPLNANLIPDAAGVIINTGATQATLGLTTGVSFAGSIGNGNPAESNIAVVKSTPAGATSDWNIYSPNTYTGPSIFNGGRVQMLGTSTFSNTSSIELSHTTLLISNNNGTSILDVNLNDRINDAAPILLRGGMIQYRGRLGEFGSETFGAVTIAEGNSIVDIAAAGTGVNETTATFASLTQQPGSHGTVRFLNPSGALGNAAQLFITAEPVLQNNLIGGWAVWDREFASYQSATGVAALNSAGYAGYSPNTIHMALATDNVRIALPTAGSTTTLTANREINSLALNATGTTTTSSTLDLGGFTLTLGSGGLIAAPITDGFGITIQNGNITSGAPNTPSDLYLHALAFSNGDGINNPANRDVTVSANIVDNGTGAVTLVIHGNEGRGTGAGTNEVFIAGSNTHSGGTFVNGGTIRLNNPAANGTSVFAIPGDLTIVGGTTNNNGSYELRQTNVFLSADSQINNAALVTIRGSGALNLDAFSQAVGGLSFINGGGNSPTLNIGTGTLTLKGNVTATSSNLGAISLISTTGIGQLSLGGATRTFDVAPVIANGQSLSPLLATLNISGAITGTGNEGIVKTGAGLLQLGGQSTFTGGVDLQAGGIIIGANSTPVTAGALNSGPLGTGLLSVANGARLLVDNASRTVANDVVFAGNPIFDSTGTATVTLALNGAITLPNGTVVVSIANPNLTAALLGRITNIASVTSLTKSGLGNLVFNTEGYTGDIIFNGAGALSLLADGDGSGNPQILPLGNITFDDGIVPNIIVGRAGSTLPFNQAQNKIIAPANLTSISNGLTVTNNNGYGLLLDDPVTLNPGAVFSVSTASASNVTQGLTLNGVLTGTNGITKTGAGTLVLGADNSATLTGTINVNQGIVSVSADNQLGDPANSVTVDATSGTAGLRATGTFSSARTLRFNDTTATNNLFEVTGGNTLTLTGTNALVNPTGLVKADNGTLELAAAQNFAGTITVSAGALKVSDAAALGTTAATTVSLQGAALQLNGVNIGNELITLNNTGINNAGALQAVGAGTSTVGGLITLASGSSIGADNGATLNIGGGFSGAQALTLNAAGTGAINFTGAIGTAAVPTNITKIGTGTAALSAASSAWTGSLVVNQGTFALTDAGIIGGTGTVTLNPTGTVTVDNTANNVANRLGGRAFTFLGGTLNYLGSATATSSEAIGTVTLPSRAINQVNVTAGAGQQANLTLGALSRGANTQGVIVFSGSNLGNAAAANTSTVTVTTAPGFVGQTAATGTNHGILPYALVHDATSGAIGFATHDGAATRLRRLATGEFVNNTLTANTNVVLGATPANLASNLTINSLDLGNNAALNINPRVTLTLNSGGLIARPGNLGINGGIIVPTTGNDPIFWTLGDLTVNSVVSGGNGLTKAGAGMLTLEQVNTYVGNTTVLDGTLKLAGGNNTLFPGQFLIVNGGTLDLNGTSQFTGGLLSDGAFPGQGGTITGPAGSILAMSQDNRNFAGRFTGGLTVTRGNTGTLTLTNSSDYTGSFIAAGGITTLTDAGAFTGVSDIRVRYATFNIVNNGLLDIANRVNDAADIRLRNGVLVFQGRAQTDSSETLGTVYLVEGSNVISSNIGGTGINSAQLNLGGLVREAQRATVNFTGSSLGSLGSASRIVIAGGVSLTNNIMGAWATTNGTEFATYNSTLGVGALGSIGFAAYDNTVFPVVDQPTQNVRLTANSTVSNGGSTINTLNLAGNVNLSFAAPTDVLNLAAGGLLKSGNNANTIGATVDSGRLTAGGNVASPRTDLFIFNNQNTLTINSRIVDNPNGTPVRTLFSGFGNVSLTNGDNSYSGGTVLLNGTVTLNGAAGTVVVPAGGISLEGAVLNMVGSSGQIHPSNVIDVGGTSSVNLFGDNTLAGLTFGNEGGTAPTVSTGGILTLTGNITSTNANVGATSLITGRLDLGADPGTITVDRILIDGVDIAPLSAGLNLTGIVGSSGFTKNGLGVLQFAAQSIFTGPVNVTEGTVQIGAVNGGSRFSDLTLQSGTRLNLNGFTTTLGSLAGSGVVTNSSLTASNLSVGFNGASTTFSGTFLRYSDAALNSVNLTKVGSGTLTFDASGAGSTTTGNLTVSRGAVAFKDQGTSSFPSSAILVNEGGTLILDNTGAANVANRLRAGALTLNGGTFRYLGADSAASTEAAGVLTLGPSASRIELLTSGAGGTATVTFSSLSQQGGSTANVVATNLGTDTQLRFTTAPALVPATTGILARIAVNGVDFATYNATNGLTAFTNYVEPGDINAVGATETVKVGSGMNVRDIDVARTVNAINFTGNGINLGATPALAPTQGLTVTSGGIMVNADDVAISTPVLNFGGAEGIFRVNGNALNVSSSVTGTAGFAKTGAGSMTLAARQSYTGQTALNSGSLILAGGVNTILVAPTASIPTVSNLQVNGGVLDLNGNSQAVGALLNSNTLAFVDGTITNTSATPATLTSASGTSSNFGSTLAGNLNFTKSGGGTLTLSDVQSYTGATIIRGGTFILQDRGVLYSGVPLANASLTLNYSTLNINNLSLTPLADLNPTRIPAGVPVTLNGSSLNLTGGGSMDSTLTIDSLTVTNGQANINVLPSINAGSTAKITIGNLTRDVGNHSFLNFNGFTTNNSTGTSSLGGQGLIANGNIILEKINGADFSAADLTNNLIGGWAVADGNTFATYVNGFGVSVMGQNTQGVQAPGFTGTDFSAATVATGNYSDGSNRTISGNKVANSLRLVPGGTQTITMSPNTSLTFGVGVISNTAQTTIFQGDATTTIAGSGTDLYFYGNQTHTDNIRTRITGSANLVKGGGATLALAPVGVSNDYTGATYVHGGTLSLNAAAGLIAVPGDLTINNSTVTMVTNSGQIAAGSNVSINGGGVLTTVGTNTLNSVTFNNDGGTGMPTVNAATKLILTSANAITAKNDNLSTTPTISGTALELSHASPVINVQSSLSSSGLIISAPLTTTGGGTISKTGAGALILSGATAHPLAGGLNIDGGEVVFDVTAATNPYGTGTIALGDGVAIRAGTAARTIANPITVAGGFTFGTLDNATGTANAANSLTLSNTVTLAAGAHTIGVNGLLMTGTISGKLTGGTDLTKAGPGTLILSNATNDYGGATIVGGGTLRNGVANAIPATSLLQVNAGAAYDLNNFSQLLQQIGGTGLITNTGAAAQTLIVGGTSASDTTSNFNSIFEGTFANGAGPLTVVKAGAGTLTLNGRSSHTGGTTINSGTVSINNSTSLGDPLNTTIINGGATLRVTEDITGFRNFRINDLATISVDAGKTYTLIGGIFDGASGNGSLIKEGAGTIVMPANNGYFGSTTINAGTLVAVSLGQNAFEPSSIGGGSTAASSLVINSGATLRYVGLGETTRHLFTVGPATGANTAGAILDASGTGGANFANTGAIALGGLATDPHTLTLTGTSAPAVTNTLASRLTGNLSLIKDGTNTWVLTNDNDFTGGTVINAGTLQLGEGGTTGMILNDATGMVTINLGGTLAFNRADDVTFAGTITGDGNVENRGTAGLTLTNANTYIGTTTIGSGSELTVTANGALGTGTAGTIVQDGGTLRFGVNYTIPEELTINGAGRNGAGAIALASGSTSASFNGPITIGPAGATINPSTDVMSATGNLTLNGPIQTANTTITFQGTGNVFIGGVIAGANGNVAVDGSTVTINNPATYTGSTLVGNGGTIVSGVTDALPVTTTLTLGAGGTLDLNGRNQSLTGLTDLGAGGRIVTNNGAVLGTLALTGSSTFGGVIQSGSAPTALSVSGAGTVFTMTGENTYTGGTTIASGSTLAVGNGGSTGSIAGNVANDGTLRFNRAGTVTYGGTVTGSGPLVKEGAGTLVFTGANNSTGLTDVQAGTLELHGSISGDVEVHGGATFDATHLAGGAFTVGSGRSFIDNGTFAGDAIVEGTFSGSGSVTGSLTANSGGAIAPGDGGIGTLTGLGALNMNPGSNLQIELAGTPLNISDLLVASSVSLSGSGAGVTLNLSLLPSSSLESTGAVFFVVSNTGGAAVSGSFANSTSTMSFGADFGGETFTVLNSPVGANNALFAISYDANITAGTFHGGNDIALMAVPEPSAGVSLLLGLGALTGLQRLRRRTAPSRS